MKTTPPVTRTHHYINGHWHQGNGPSFISVNPADGRTLWEGREATPEEISLAYEAAHAALASWADLTLENRIIYLQKFSAQIDKRREELAQHIASETGKPLWEANTEVNSVIGKINLSIDSYHARTSTRESIGQDAISRLRYKPHGVVAVLGPFNFPAHLSNGHIIPALLAGNTIVYKPSELTPMVAAFIMSCWDQAELPAGVLNCVQGSANCAKRLLQHDIQAVYFTGSYKAGAEIHSHFSGRPEVLLALEMGGNNPLIIDEIDDIDAAVYTTLLSTLITSGQRCTCARRVFVPFSGTGDAFIERLIHAYERVKIGAFTEAPEPFMGPVIGAQHALNHLKAQTRLINLGGTPLMAMSLLRENTGFLSPGIIDMTQVALSPDEEIFAPFTQIYRYREFDEALIMANQTQYGLSAGLLSNNSSHYKQFYQTIRAGLVNWNKPTTGAASNMPFGGVGKSGNHRPTAYFAADYCAYPIASQELDNLEFPKQLLPGISFS
jgi:succinylglutamic semialdehyde dehydrogenase